MGVLEMNQNTFYAVRQARAWLEQSPLFLDTETTGLSSTDGIIDLALIDHDNTALIETLIRPTAPISQIASEIHHIRDEDVIDAPSFGEVLINLTKLTKGRLVLIYNATFDLRMLRQSATAHRARLPYINAGCVMRLYTEFHGKKTALGEASLNFGVVGCDLHRAAVDARLCREIVLAVAATQLPGEKPTK